MSHFKDGKQALNYIQAQLQTQLNRTDKAKGLVEVLNLGANFLRFSKLDIKIAVLPFCE